MRRPTVRSTARLLASLLVATALLPIAGTAVAATPDRYSIRLKAWIPQEHVTAPLLGLKPNRFCQDGARSTVYFNGNNHRGWSGNDADDHKALVSYDFTWDGAKMGDLSTNVDYGFTRETMRNWVTGASCSMEDRVTSDGGVVATGPASVKLWTSTKNPFYVTAPAIDAELNARFTSSNRLVVDMKSDSFPSYGYQVLKNGVPIATVQSWDAWCVKTDGPQGIAEIQLGLTSGEGGAWISSRQDVDIRAAGMTYSQPCDAKYTAAPLRYPAPVQYLPAPPVVTPPPSNQAPVASFSWQRLAGRGNNISVNGQASRDPDGKVATWQWFSGSTLLGTGSTATLPMGVGTTKSLTLQVTDDRGSKTRLTKSLSLPNRPPVIEEISPRDGAVAGTVTPTLAAVARDDDGDPLQYQYRVTGPQVDVTSSWSTGPWTVPTQKLDPAQTYTWSVTAKDGSGATAGRSSTFVVASLPVASDVVSTADGAGYWQVASDGGVFSYGSAQFYGSVPGLGIRLTNIMGMARTPSGNGYWLVGSDGGVFSFGDAAFYGSLPGNTAVNNIVGMVPTKSGRGYWLVGSDGGVFSFGDAGFYGSMGGRPLNAPVTGIAATRTSGGYWLVARDGGIFTFGDAPFYGSMGGRPLNAPVTDMDITQDGGGYWLTAEDGGIFTFGNAGFFGSTAGRPLAGHITGMSATPSGQGYWLNGCDGGVFTFGDAPFLGSNPTFQCRGVS